MDRIRKTYANMNNLELPIQDSDNAFKLLIIYIGDDGLIDVIGK